MRRSVLLLADPGVFAVVAAFAVVALQRLLALLARTLPVS